MDEYSEIKQIREILQASGVDPYEFLRVIPLSHMVKDFELMEMRTDIPGLKAIYPQIKETLSITPSLAQLKISDLVAEGAEPFSFWKEVWRIETMSEPKLTLPKSTSADIISDLALLKGADGTKPQALGGDMDNVDFDTSGNKGYFRGATSIQRNWLKDNNFRALEIHLKEIGEALAYGMGKFIADTHITDAGITDTRANIDGASGKATEALANVIEDKLPTTRFTPDTMIMHPTDAVYAKVEQWGTAGPIPLMSATYLDRDGRNITEPGIAALLGLKKVWRTPWMTSATVLIFAKEKAEAVGLRQDIEFEDFGDTLMGLVGSVISTRFDVKEIFDAATYKITAFRTA